jgi:hypothetical protein
LEVELASSCSSPKEALLLRPVKGESARRERTRDGEMERISLLSGRGKEQSRIGRGANEGIYRILGGIGSFGPRKEFFFLVNEKEKTSKLVKKEIIL